MSISGIIILLLPIILHIKGNTAVLVFLIMNSIINLLMQYTKIQIQIITSITMNDDRIQELHDQGIDFDEAFEDYMSGVDINDYTNVPKPIRYAGNISMAIGIISIIIGIVQIIR